MTVIFSSLFKADLAAAEEKIESVSIQGCFRTCVLFQVRQIIKRKGDGPVGPHGFRCRGIRPYQYHVCYYVDQKTIYFLGLAYVRPQPKYLKRLLENTALSSA